MNGVVQKMGKKIFPSSQPLSIIPRFHYHPTANSMYRHIILFIVDFVAEKCHDVFLGFCRHLWRCVRAVAPFEFNLVLHTAIKYLFIDPCFYIVSGKRQRCFCAFFCTRFRDLPALLDFRCCRNVAAHSPFDHTQVRR